jgi:hypothetical protein
MSTGTQFSFPMAKLSTSSSNLKLFFLALVSVGCGTVLAANSVPDDVGVATALFVPALNMTIGLMIPVILQIRTDLTALLRVENALLIGIVYWLMLDMLQAAYPFTLVTAEDVQWGFVAVGVFAAALCLGAFVGGWGLPSVVANTAYQGFAAQTLFMATLIAFVAGMANFSLACSFDPVCMIQGVSADRWSAPWARGNLGDARALLEQMQYFGYIMPSLCVMMAMRVGWFNWRVLTGLVLSAIVIAFLAQSGGRRIIGVVVGAALFTWVACRPRVGPKVIFGGTAVVVLLLAFMQVMLTYRKLGLGAWVAGVEIRDDPSLGYHLHVDDNFLRLTQLINFIPDKFDFVLYQPLYHALTLSIPRVFWPGKPTGPGIDLPTLVGLKGVSLSSSIVGELYESYGIFAVAAGGWFFGRLAGMWSKLLQLPSTTGGPLMYGLGLMAMFTGLRSLQALVQMSYIVFAWIVLAKFLHRSGSSARQARRTLA